MPKPPSRNRTERSRGRAALPADAPTPALRRRVAALGKHKAANESGEASSQRRSERVELRVEIGIDDHTNFYVGFSENVSAGGLFAATYTLLPVGTSIALTCVLPGELPLFVQGIVRWVRPAQDAEGGTIPPGMGIEFVGLGYAESSRIQAYIERRGPLYPDA